MGPQALIYFGVAVGALFLAVKLLYSRYVRNEPSAMRSGGGTVFFVFCLILFAVGAVVAGYGSIQAGR